LKIIQLIQKPQLRGAEIFACQLSNHLLEKGIEVLVVSIFKGDSNLPFKGELLELNRPISKRFTDITGWKEFSKIVKSFKPDIIQANAADTLKFAVSSKFIFSWNTPIIFRNANKMGDFIDSKFKWALNKFYISKLDYVISVSKECEKDFIKTFQYPLEKIRTVYIGVEESEGHNKPDDLREIMEKGKLVTHIGSFVPEKNQSGLIDIFKQILGKNPDAQLLLIGKGKLENEMKQKVLSLNLQNNVHFLGYRNDVLDILYYSHAFVLPSFIEGLPAVILEAMYCETPVVAYNVGGIGEVVISDKTGWLVAKNDQDSFVKSLLEIMTEQPKIEEHISRAKLMVSQNFMNTIIADRFLDCYKYVSKQT
jgi:glycosyltransferase involved in cell wall biosynthesis